MLRTAVIGTFCFALIACSPKPTTALGGGSASAEPRLSAAATLQERLPADTIGYLRLPSPFGTFIATRNRTLDRARTSPEHIAAIEKLQQSIAKLPELLTAQTAPVKIALAHWRSPLEIAYVAPGRAAMAPPKIVLRVMLPGLNTKALAEALQGIAPPTSTGPSEIIGPNYFARFNEKDGELLVLAGEGVNAEGLDKLLANTAKELPFAAAQERNEQSKQSLFLWADLSALQPIIAGGSMLSKEFAPLINRLALEGKSLTIAAGTVAGKGRLSLELDATQGKLLHYLPRESKTWNISTVGAPDYFMSASLLPSPTEWQEMATQVKSDFGPEPAKLFASASTELRKHLGVSLDDFLAALGPDIGFFSDAAGSFFAVRMRDKAAWARVLEQINALPNSKLKQSGSVNLIQLRMDPPEPSDETAKFLARLTTTLAWVDEGEYLVFSGLPQPLRDRARLKPDTKVSDWLMATQGHRASQTLLGAFGPTRDVQRNTWYAWIGALAALSDLTNAELDIAQLPSAEELGLPRDGSVGLEWQASADRMSFVLGYDATPVDLLGGSPVAVVAGAGILAAVAIPAYQDYKVRAIVSAALAETAAAKTVLIESMVSTNEIPDELASLGVEETLSEGHQLRWENGMLLIGFAESAPSGVAGKQLALGVRWNEGSPLWVCGLAEPNVSVEELIGGNPAEHTTLENKYLPSSCRAPGA